MIADNRLFLRLHINTLNSSVIKNDETWTESELGRNCIKKPNIFKARWVVLLTCLICNWQETWRP